MAAPAEYAPFLEGLACAIYRAPSGSYSFVQVFARYTTDLRSRLRPALNIVGSDGVF